MTMRGSETSPELLAAMAAQARELSSRHVAMETEIRRGILHWAAILCTCPPWFGQPGDHCVVHGQFAVLPDGRIL
jgi:hypothetical protein